MIKNFLNKYSDAGILFFYKVRHWFRLYFFVHGWGKITRGPELWGKLGGSMSNLGITFAPEFWGFMSAFAEFGGGILLLIGLFSRTAAFFMAFNMLVAATQHLSKLDPWNKAIYPMELFGVFMGLIFLTPENTALAQFFLRKENSGD
jgi:putative oxidoreductase